MTNSTTHVKMLGRLLTLTFSLLSVAIPVWADESPITNPKPLDIPTGNIQDLEGIKTKDHSEGLGGVGGEFSDSDNASSDGTESVYQMQGSLYQSKIENYNANLENFDPKIQDTYRINLRLPFSQF